METSTIDLWIATGKIKLPKYIIKIYLGHLFDESKIGILHTHTQKTNIMSALSSSNSVLSAFQLRKVHHTILRLNLKILNVNTNLALKRSIHRYTKKKNIYKIWNHFVSEFSNIK